MTRGRIEIPDDEYVEVTSIGSDGPVFLLAKSGKDVALAKARAMFFDGTSTVDQFETDVETILAAP